MKKVMGKQKEMDKTVGDKKFHVFLRKSISLADSYFTHFNYLQRETFSLRGTFFSFKVSIFASFLVKRLKLCSKCNSSLF